MRDHGDLPRSRGRAPDAESPDISEGELRNLTWECCGITRCRDGLERALNRLNAAVQGDRRQPRAANLAALELRNLHAVATLIAQCALWREESRGAHFRSDFPVSRREFQRPSSISRIASATRA